MREGGGGVGTIGGIYEVGGGGKGRAVGDGDGMGCLK